MSFFIYLHKNEFQPEDPQVFDYHLKHDTQLTFIDFIPSIIKRSSTSIINSNEIEYHPFKKMIETANKWLEKNSNYDLINCETLKIFFKYNDTQNYYDLAYNDVSSYIYGTEKNNLLKALRLWIKRKEMANQTMFENFDANYTTNSFDSPISKQESPKLSKHNFCESSSTPGQQWMHPQNRPEKMEISKNFLTKQSRIENHSKMCQLNKTYSTDHSPKKNAFHQQQTFRSQQYSSQSKFFLSKLQRQISCPQSNDSFQMTHSITNANQLTQNSPVLPPKRLTNEINMHQYQLGNQNSPNSSKLKNFNSIILNYVDILPKFNELEKFERLDDCLDKLNHLIANGLIKGRILSVETLTCEANVEWKIDTECSFTAVTSRNVKFLRCFYIENEYPETNQRIRIMDFIPDYISGGGFFKKPKFENFSLIFPKVTEWLVNNSKYEFKNTQTLEIKFKCYFNQEKISIDTKSMSFTEHGDYLKILRLVYSEKVHDNQISINKSIDNKYTKYIENDKVFLKKNGNENIISIKHDLEGLKQSGLDAAIKEIKSDNLKDEKINDEFKNSINYNRLMPKFCEYSANSKRPIYLISKLFLIQRKDQKINDLKQEIQDWFNNYLTNNNKSKNGSILMKPEILACETIPIFCKQNDVKDLQKGVEESFMYNRFGLKNGYVVNVFRIYFNLGWFKFKQIEYGQKINEAEKMQRKFLNYWTSVDEVKSKKSLLEQQSQKKALNKHVSFEEFYSDYMNNQSNEFECKAKTNAQISRLNYYELNNFKKKFSNSDYMQASSRSKIKYNNNNKSNEELIKNELDFKNSKLVV